MSMLLTGIHIPFTLQGIAKIQEDFTGILPY